MIALSIEQVGEETARLIADHCGSLEAVKKVSSEQLAAIHGVGDIVARSLTDWFADTKNQLYVKALTEHVTIIAPQRVAKDTPLSGKTLVFTGTLAMLSRDEAKDMARKAGAIIGSSVSKQTDYVVIGDNPGSKATKAHELGITVLEEKEFKQLLKE
ncbi:MAG: helix-hairpin-helix domain-containing protein [Candidatus Paceibacterota bacterium]